MDPLSFMPHPGKAGALHELLAACVDPKGDCCVAPNELVGLENEELDCPNSPVFPKDEVFDGFAPKEVWACGLKADEPPKLDVGVGPPKELGFPNAEGACVLPERLLLNPVLEPPIKLELDVPGNMEVEVLKLGVAGLLNGNELVPNLGVEPKVFWVLLENGLKVLVPNVFSVGGEI